MSDQKDECNVAGQGAGPQAQPQDAGPMGEAPLGGGQPPASGDYGYQPGQAGVNAMAGGLAGPDMGQAGGSCGCGETDHSGGAPAGPQMGYPAGPQGGPQTGQPAGSCAGPEMGFAGGPYMGPSPGALGGPPPMGHPGVQGAPSMGHSPGGQSGYSEGQPHICNHGGGPYGPMPGYGPSPMPGPMPGYGPGPTPGFHPGQAGGFHPGMPPGAHPGFAGTHSPTGQEAQLSQMMGMFSDIMNGNTDMSKVTSWLGGVDTSFWKGALMGAALALLVSSPMVSDTVKGMFSGLMGGGAQEEGKEA